MPLKVLEHKRPTLSPVTSGNQTRFHLHRVYLYTILKSLRLTTSAVTATHEQWFLDRSAISKQIRGPTRKALATRSRAKSTIRWWLAFGLLMQKDSKIVDISACESLQRSLSSPPWNTAGCSKQGTWSQPTRDRKTRKNLEPQVRG